MRICASASRPAENAGRGLKLELGQVDAAAPHEHAGRGLKPGLDASMTAETVAPQSMRGAD